MQKLLKIAARMAVVLTAVTVIACTDSTFPDVTGEGSVRGVNAVVGLSDVGFLIEETTIDTLAFKASSATVRYDDLSYRFNFDLAVPDGDPVRLVSSEIDVVRDTDYTFVLAGDTTAQQMLVWERPERTWSGTDTNFDVNIGHANVDLGAVDVYVAAPDTLPVAGNAAGTVAFGERLDAIEFAAGDYQIVLTTAGDPADVLYQSDTIAFAAADSYQLVVLATDPDATGPLSLRLINQSGASAELADERFPPTVQFVNASLATGPIDVALANDFATPAVAGLPFAGVSGDIDTSATTTYQYAGAGTTTALLDEEASVLPGSRSLFLLVGTAANLSTLRLPSVRRGFSNLARLRLINTLTNTEAVDIYVREPGTDINEVFPSLANATLGFVSLTPQRPGDYEITLTPNGSKTVLAGPIPVNLPTGEVTEIVLLDTVDPNTADLLVFSNADP